MTKRRAISRSAAAFVALGVAIAAAGLALPRLRPVAKEPDPELVALRRALDRSSEFNDQVLHDLRRRANARPRVAWSEAQLARLALRLAAEWRCTWHAAATDSRVLLLARRSDAMADWAGTLDAIRSWSDRPGVLLEAVELTAEGAGPSRYFSRACLRLRLAIAGAKGSAERPPSGPLPAPGGLAAPDRDVGSGPERHNPNPAPGRPDDPGESGGMGTLVRKIPNEEKP